MQFADLVPFVYFDRRESFQTLQVEDYLATCNVWRDGIDQGQATLHNIQGNNVNLHSRIDWVSRNPSAVVQEKDVSPCYINSRPIPNTTLVQVEFYFLFGYNSSYNQTLQHLLCGVCSEEVCGGHQSDWEKVVLVVDEQTHVIQRVFFSAHRNTDGYWKRFEDCETIGGRLVVYCARGSHGFYHTAGIWPRLACIANDHTSRGRCVLPTVSLVGDWFELPLTWGPVSGNTPSFLDVEHVVNPMNNTWLGRLCACCDSQTVRSWFLTPLQ